MWWTPACWPTTSWNSSTEFNCSMGSFGCLWCGSRSCWKGPKRMAYCMTQAGLARKWCWKNCWRIGRCWGKCSCTTGSAFPSATRRYVKQLHIVSLLPWNWPRLLENRKKCKTLHQSKSDQEKKRKDNKMEFIFDITLSVSHQRKAIKKQKQTLEKKQWINFFLEKRNASEILYCRWWPWRRTRTFWAASSLVSPWTRPSPTRAMPMMFMCPYLPSCR